MNSMSASLVMGGASKKFVEETAEGMGALKGSPATVKEYAIDETTGDTIVTFEWEDTNHVKHTEDVVVKRGIEGPQGETGNGIVSITKTDTVGLVDTYTILYSDGTTSMFTVTNGSGSGGVEIDDTTTSIDKVWSSDKINTELSDKATKKWVEEVFGVDYIKCVEVNPVADVFTDPKVIFNTTSEKFYSLNIESRSFKKYTNANDETIYVFDLVDGADIYSARVDGRLRPARTKLVKEDDYFIYHYTESGTTIEEHFYAEDYVENVNGFYGYWEEIEIGSSDIEVINNLTSTSTTDALSANMGKELDESKADKSTTYTKTEIDSLIGDVETLLADL